jgi:hypothetical protein
MGDDGHAMIAGILNVADLHGAAATRADKGSRHRWKLFYFGAMTINI